MPPRNRELQRRGLHDLRGGNLRHHLGVDLHELRRWHFLLRQLDRVPWLRRRQVLSRSGERLLRLRGGHLPSIERRVGL